MLKELLSKELVILRSKANTPEEVIREAGKLLVRAGKVDESYVDGMIDSYHKLGPYIVLAPSIAMPHARPGEWVKEPCLSFVQLDEPVKFNHPENDPVKLVFALGGSDKESHLEMLRELSIVLADQKKVEELRKAVNYEDVLKTIIGPID